RLPVAGPRHGSDYTLSSVPPRVHRRRRPRRDRGNERRVEPMRNKTEFRGKRRGGRGSQRTPKPPGGKALQRLFAFLAKRDPALNNDIVAAIPVPKSARPNYALTAQALRAKLVTVATAARPRTP